MRAVIQRVSRAEVRVDSKIKGTIQQGLLVFLAIHKSDAELDAHWLFDKICNLRIFSNESGKFDLSLQDIQGQMLIVSQFTLYGDCRKGRRPSFESSAPPDIAIPLYDKAINYMKSKGIHTESGEFGAMMEVDFINDGPVTLILDSPEKNA